MPSTAASSYCKAIELLDGWAERGGLSVLEMKASDADAFIDSLEGSPSTVRLRAAAVSSFFTFLKRETDGRVRNPFRGTKARPAKKTKAPVVPSDAEVECIAEHLSPINLAAVIVKQEHGFRVGALQSLSIRNGRYTAFSKGKEIYWTLSKTASMAIREAGLDGKESFADLTDDSVRNAFNYAAKKMHSAGTLAESYSVHDIRHCYAIREYRKDKDIYRLKVLLHHASIQVTENYLRGLAL